MLAPEHVKLSLGQLVLQIQRSQATIFEVLPSAGLASSREDAEHQVDVDDSPAPAELRCYLLDDSCLPLIII